MHPSKAKFAFFLLSLILASSDGADSVSKAHRSRGTFRPRAHFVRVEKYRQDASLSNFTDDGVLAQPSSDTTVKTTTTELSVKATLANNDQKPSSLSQVATGSSTTSIVQTVKRSLQNVITDDMNRQILATTLPLSAIYAIMPLASAVDLFWINRLKDPLAVAGQSAATQMYGSLFWLFSFLPNITATLVSKRYATGDMEGTQDAVCQALMLGLLISTAGTALMFLNPARVLSSILKAGSPAMDVAKPFLKIRTFSFMPMLISFVGFSTFRGLMDVKLSAQIALFSNLVLMTLDPIFIHVFKFGVRGAAMAALSGDILAASIYIKLLRGKNLIPIKKLTRLPSWSSIAPLIKGGVSLQVRSFAYNLTMLTVARVIQSMDDSGVVPAAHALALQTFQLGAIAMGALGSATQTLVPNAMARTGYDGEATTDGPCYAHRLVKRLFVLGSSLGLGIGLIQMLLLPALLSSSPLAEVREAARIPALISCAFQCVNGMVNVGEGVLMGSGNFTWLSFSSVVAALGYFGALQVLPQNFGLTGVWISSALFSLLRLAGVIVHLLLKNPLSTTPKKANPRT